MPLFAVAKLLGLILVSTLVLREWQDFPDLALAIVYSHEVHTNRSDCTWSAPQTFTIQDVKVRSNCVHSNTSVSFLQASGPNCGLKNQPFFLMQPFEEGVQHTANQKCTDNEHASSKKQHKPRSSRAWNFRLQTVCFIHASSTAVSATPFCASERTPTSRPGMILVTGGAQHEPTGYASSMVLSKAILYVEP
ncbi:hypothetical protein B0H14DRAFT_2589495 [Mycena olivaceomarginata]|nr:hypothetical protein B0H14DRAFT_2589495 [Mycena olivaceomarginata]